VKFGGGGGVEVKGIKGLGDEEVLGQIFVRFRT